MCFEVTVIFDREHKRRRVHVFSLKELSVSSLFYTMSVVSAPPHRRPSLIFAFFLLITTRSAGRFLPFMLSKQNAAQRPLAPLRAIRSQTPCSNKDVR